MTCESSTSQTLRLILIVTIPIIVVQVCLTAFGVRNGSAVAREAWQGLFVLGTIWLASVVIDGWLRELIYRENVRRRGIPLAVRAKTDDGRKRRALSTVARTMRWPFDP